MNKKILVVDDNDVNLELILLLIRQYAQEENQSLDIFTATDGEKAVDICNEQQIDIIFMDLMMPKMNGIEATKMIKAHHPKTMIIVISAFGDESKQKEMLRNGAEDYMIKPVTAPLFKSRLRNYLQLVQTRNHIGRKAKPHNLFTSKVYNYHMSFTVVSDADLSEFWEAILMRFDFQSHIEHASDLVRFIFRLGTLQLQHHYQFHIIIEEDTDNFYFTLDNIKLIGCEKANALIKNYFAHAPYRCKENLLTFMLQKSLPEELFETSFAVETRTPPQQTVDVSVFETPVNEEMKTFDILDPDELENFEDNLLKLRSLILMMGKSTLEASDVEELCSCFNQMASILSISNDTYVLSNALHELSGAISENQENFKESSAQLFDFVNAFVNDLIFWKSKIFYEGAPSVDFLNDSITTNANMLHALLQPESKADENIDDIFDF